MNDDQVDPAAMARVAHLRQERQDLDDAIAALQSQPRPDQLQIARLKKRKLSLRDQIARLEDRLTPDIIA
ncbi:MAG TPA: YdcH family protein [Caulobacteraceae bacterium]